MILRGEQRWATPPWRHIYLWVMVVIVLILNKASIFNDWSRIIVIIPNVRSRSGSCQSDWGFWQGHHFCWSLRWWLKLEDSQLGWGREKGFLLIVNRWDRVHFLTFHLHQQTLSLLRLEIFQKFKLYLVNLCFFDNYLLLLLHYYFYLLWWISFGWLWCYFYWTGLGSNRETSLI